MIVGDVVVSELPHADTTIAIANTAAPPTVFTTTTPQLTPRVTTEALTAPLTQRYLTQGGDTADLGECIPEPTLLLDEQVISWTRRPRCRKARRSSS